MKAIGHFSDGRSLGWDDGVVSGSPVLEERLDALRGTVLRTPEGPELPASEWRTNVEAVVAALEELPRQEGVALRWEMEGMPVLARPPGVA